MAMNFFAQQKFEGDIVSFSLASELIVYASVCMAMVNSGKILDMMTWSTFQRAIENRMLGIADDGSVRSGTVNTPDGPAFAHFSSSYRDEMDSIDEMASKNASQELLNYLIRKTKGTTENQEEFNNFLLDLVSFSSQYIFPKLELW